MASPHLQSETLEAPHSRSLPALIRKHGRVLVDVASVYGVQFGNYVFPLITIPYLSRVLGPEMWGLTAMAGSFGMYGHIIVEYGFIYSATRDLATSTDRRHTENVLAGVTGARLILATCVLLAAFAAQAFVPLFHEHPLLLWAAVIAEIFKGSLPNYYFYGIHRVTTASFLDIAARGFAMVGVFFLVRKPADAWIFYALQGLGALTAILVAHWMIYSQYSMRMPRLRDGLRMLREGASMFLFRSSHNLFVLGNAFILGLFAPPQAVGFYAGAEKINTAAVNMLSPVTTALFPRAASMAKSSLGKAAQLTNVTLFATLAFSALLSVVMWFGAPIIIPLILGPGYEPSINVMRILGLRAPLVGWTFVLGFQWMLSLELEKPFQIVTLLALGCNALLATVFAPHFSYTGMAWTVVVSHLVAAVGIFYVLRKRRLLPFALGPRSANA